MNQPNLQIHKVNQFLQSLYQFSSGRSNQNPFFSEVAQAVQNITNNNQNKLQVKIFSQFPILSQAFYKFFAINQSLPQFYEFNIVEFPHEFQTFSPNQPLNPTLTLKANQETGQTEYCQELNPNKNILIGRDAQKLRQHYRSQNAIILDLPNYKQVSSIHGEISLKPYSNASTWQITDLGSKNGTFVNDQKINETQILKSGDVITLANDFSSSKAPKFIFTGPSINTEINSSSVINHGDLICLIINPQKPFNNQERQLIHQASQTKICALIIIPESSEFDNDNITEQNNAYLSTLSQYPSLKNLTKISHLVLQPFYTNSPNPISNSNLQEKYADFVNNLIEIAQIKSGEIIQEKTIDNIQAQINRLDLYYQKQTEKLASQLQYLENQLQVQAIKDSKSKLKDRLRRVKRERKDFFKDQERKISDSKTNLMGDYREFSLSNKISISVAKLEPLVTKEFGQVEIKLIKNGQDSHEIMIKLIKSQLKQWLRAEWIQITTKLNDLIEYSYEELNFIPSFSLSNSFRPPNEQLNQQEILQDSFVSAQNNSSYSQISIDELIELEQSAFEGIPQIFEEGSSFAISLISGSPSAIIQGGKLLHSLTQLVGKVLSYRDIKKNELQEVISQLKDQNSEYYQRLADFLADKLLNNMMTALDDEKRNFRLSLDHIEDQFETYFRQLKNYDQQYKQKQKFLQKEMLDFEQIKSLIKL